jgi:cell fate regulator YaaT (PSP1 superfamily)
MIDEFFAYREPAAVGVSFRRSGKVYYFAANGLRVRQGDQVIAETDKGVDIGEVVFIKFELPEMENRDLKPLVRKATPEDIAHEQELQLKEREARKVCEKMIIEHKLPMRLIAADYTFDAQRLVFFFSSEGRVDFRNLVRDLAEIFHTRIELRQVGVRDQAKMVGGLGPCGRPLCCNAFLRNFDPVGIRVAKDQGLSLNPAKISGICDRLMCCLKYEHEMYLELARKLPKPGQMVNTRKGPAEVRAINLMHERISVRYPNDDYEDLKATEVWGIDEEPPPLPEVKPGDEDDMPPPEDKTLPLMVRQRPKQAQRSERPARTERPERPERPSRTRPERGARPERPAGEGPGRPQTRPLPTSAAPAPAQPAAPSAEGEGEAAGASKRRRRRRPDRRRSGGSGSSGEGQQPAEGQPQTEAPQAQQQRPPRERKPQPQTPPQPKPKPEGEASADQPAGERSARRRRPRFRSRKKPGGEGGGGETGGAPSGAGE